MATIYPRLRGGSPWGQIDTIDTEGYPEGVVSVSTPGHGGLFVCDELMKQMHPAVLAARAKGGFFSEGPWFEEDCEWALAVEGLPKLEWTIMQRYYADKTVRDGYPEIWEAIHGRELKPGQSYEKDERAWFAAHAESLLSVTRRPDPEDKSMLIVTAQKGGRRGWRDPVNTSPKIDFRVPKAEVRQNEWPNCAGPERPFVIDLARHERIS